MAAETNKCCCSVNIKMIERLTTVSALVPIVRPCKPNTDISGLTEFGATEKMARIIYIV